MLLKLMFAWVDVFFKEIRQWIQISKSTVYISVHFKKKLIQDANFGEVTYTRLEISCIMEFKLPIKRET